MKDTVQLHVDVSRELWKSIKQSALDGGDTLKGVVGKALQKSFGESGKPVVGPGADRMPSQGGSTPPSGAKILDSLPEYEGGPIMGKCSKCGDVFSVASLITHPKMPGKKFCADCVENMKNGQ